MENQKPTTENAPKDPNQQLDGTNTTEDRPKTPSDGFSDQGSSREDFDDEKQESTNAEEGEIPELNPDRNDVEGQRPTDFDIDESTG